MATDSHRFDFVGHVELAEVRHALVGCEGDFGALKVLVLVRFDGGIGAYDDAFNIIVPIPTLQVFQRGEFSRALDLKMRIVFIVIIVFVNFHSTGLIDHFDIQVGRIDGAAECERQHSAEQYP